MVNFRSFGLLTFISIVPKLSYPQHPFIQILSLFERDTSIFSWYLLVWKVMLTFCRASRTNRRPCGNTSRSLTLQLQLPLSSSHIMLIGPINRNLSCLTVRNWIGKVAGSASSRLPAKFFQPANSELLPKFSSTIVPSLDLEWSFADVCEVQPCIRSYT